MHVGQNIKKLRELRGMTQTELARLAGFQSRSSINKIESCERDVTQSKLVSIAAALRVPVGALFGDKPAEAYMDSGLSPREERDIERDLEDMMQSVASANFATKGAAEDNEALKAALRVAMSSAKRAAKKKYTPRKYRK